MPSEEQAVITAVQTMTEAFHAGDIEAVMASYEPAATIAFEPGAPQSDRAAQRAWFEQAFQTKPTFSYAGHEVVIAGALATHFAPWTMSATGPDGTQITQTGLSVAVLRKQSDGRWLIVIDSPHGDHLRVVEERI